MTNLLDTSSSSNENLRPLRHKVRFQAGYKSPLKTCTECGCTTLRVLESLPYATFIKRRKQCVSCGHRISTHEILVSEGGEALNYVPKHFKNKEKPVTAPKELKKPIKSKVPLCVRDGCVHWDGSCTMGFSTDELDGKNCACFVAENAPDFIL